MPRVVAVVAHKRILTREVRTRLGTNFSREQLCFEWNRDAARQFLARVDALVVSAELPWGIGLFNTALLRGMPAVLISESPLANLRRLTTEELRTDGVESRRYLGPQAITLWLGSLSKQPTSADARQIAILARGMRLALQQ